MEVCNIILNNSNTFCKQLYTCMCNFTKKLSFLVKTLHNVTHNKDLKEKTINCINFALSLSPAD